MDSKWSCKEREQKKITCLQVNKESIKCARENTCWKKGWEGDRMRPSDYGLEAKLQGKGITDYSCLQVNEESFIGVLRRTSVGRRQRGRRRSEFARKGNNRRDAMDRNNWERLVSWRQPLTLGKRWKKIGWMRWLPFAFPACVPPCKAASRATAAPLRLYIGGTSLGQNRVVNAPPVLSLTWSASQRPASHPATHPATQPASQTTRQPATASKSASTPTALVYLEFYVPC